MEININQKKVSLTEKYNITVDGMEAYRAGGKFLRLLSEITLTRKSDEQVCLTIKRKFSWLKPRYKIIFPDGKVLDFIMHSFWTGWYKIVDGNNTYDIYSHRSRKCSVFLNDKQIAWWDKNAVSIMAGDKYKVIADRDCYKELLIAFALIVDDYKAQKDSGLINFDIGRLGAQERKFDTNWQPK